MKKIIKRIFVSVGALVLVVVLLVGGYVAYLAIDYSRIGNVELDVENNPTSKLTKTKIINDGLTISTYNIGFGAYSREYSFFMDKAEFKDEYKDSQGASNTAGEYSRALSKLAATNNTNGAYQTIVENISPRYGAVDFALYQEVDHGSTRSYQVDQLALGDLAHADYASIFASNYHSGYLMYPFTSPIGASNSGITTYSKYQVKSADRHEFSLSDGFFDRFFDLDRAFSVTQIEIDGDDRLLFVFNVHMSAYDATGEIRKAQLLDLKEAVVSARNYNDKENYVVVGGDFNHDLIVSNDAVDFTSATWFNQQEQEGFKTDWYNFLRADRSINEGADFFNPKTGETEPYSFDLSGTDLVAYGPVNLPSARDASIAFVDKNENDIIDNFMCSIDGFLVSDNIIVDSVETIGSGINGQEEALELSDPRYGYGFVYSDHNPVVMEFNLVF